MSKNAYTEASKKIQVVTYYAIVFDILLFVLKTIIGLMAGSIW
ncbi:MAG: hypothetical protein ACYSTX_03935 [Planctomycetota bacterium]